MKTNYKNLFLLLCFVSTMAYSQQTVFIDFGSAATETAGNYNNATDVSSNGTPIADLINDTGASTGFGYNLNDGFIDRNTTGSTSPTGDAATFDAEATRDSFFGSIGHAGVNDPNGGFTLTGLDNNKYYSFEVFAARLGVGDVREALYTVTGSTTATGTLNSSNNETNTVMINDVQPTGGQITFDATHGAGNTNGAKYFYLGAVKMQETTNPLAVDDFIIDNGGLSVYPNPVEDVLNINYVLKNASKTSITIYDVTRRLIFSADNGLNQPGTYNFKWNRINNEGSRAASGIYLLKMETETSIMTKKIILK